MLRLAALLFFAIFAAHPVCAEDDSWQKVDVATIADDDIARHRSDADYFNGVEIGQKNFSENGFDWQLIRFVNSAKPDGPLFMVPHDSENAAFDAMIIELRKYGGSAVVVNSGPGKDRNQSGHGTCGGRPGFTTSCDPNRNFSDATPLYTAAFLNERMPGQPVIALHTNSAGYGSDGHGGAGTISMYASARPDSFFGNGTVSALNNPDSFALMSYRAGASPPAKVIGCRTALNGQGINFWQERVGRSDGSMSNYLILNHPDIVYFNAESREESDLALSASRHVLMVDAFMANCANTP